MRSSLLIIFVAMLVAMCLAQAPFDPRNPPIVCEMDGENPITSLEDATGRVGILWIVCTADSGALPQDWPLGTGPGHRVCNPVTYQMPSWANAVFDSTTPWSLSSYYLDQSGGRFGLTGRVVGRDSVTVFKCDPDPAVRPIHDTQSGGGNFFHNIMAKVDSFVDLREFLPDSTSRDVPFAIFNIYALAESCRAEGGGLSGLADVFTSTHQRNSLGELIRISQGVTCWSIAEQAYTDDFCPGWGVPDSILAAYWPNLAIAAHELGHRIGGGHLHSFCDCNYSALWPYNHAGCGSFDPMSFGFGFPDPENGNVAGAVCPYNPYWRNDLGWMTIVDVDHPLMNYIMTDHLLRTSDVCLKIPSYCPGEPSDQYFLVTAVTRNSPWDRLWPANGLMIMHANPTQSQNDCRHKRFDVELASGLYEWTVRHEMSNPAWNCSTSTGICSLYTGENLLTRNTVTGLDSFDFQWAHNPLADWPIQMYCGLNDEPYPTGTGASFFQTGRVFSDTSNPSAAAQRNAYPYAQDLPTMAGVQVLALEPWNGTCTVNAWSRHWSGNVTTDALWLDSIIVDADVTIAAEATLTIHSGTYVNVSPGAKLRIEGRIVAQGTEQNPIVFTCSDTTQTWFGISIRSDDEGNLLDYVEISHAYIGVNVRDGHLTLRHSTLRDCERYGVAYCFASGIVDECTVTVRLPIQIHMA